MWCDNVTKSKKQRTKYICQIGHIFMYNRCKVIVNLY